MGSFIDDGGTVNILLGEGDIIMISVSNEKYGAGVSLLQSTKRYPIGIPLQDIIPQGTEDVDCCAPVLARLYCTDSDSLEALISLLLDAQDRLNTQGSAE